MKKETYDEIIKSLEQAIEKVKEAQKEESYYFDFESEYYMVDDPNKIPMKVVRMDGFVLRLQSENLENVITGDKDGVREKVNKF